MPGRRERKALVLGVISDTHGLIRGRAIRALRGVDHIVHAGDIGTQDVLFELERVAPVSAVRGNMDHAGGWDRPLPFTAVVEAGEASLYLLHDLMYLDLDPGAAGISAVIFGHTHWPSIEQRDGVLYLNPGSAGPARHNKPVSLATLEVRGQQLTPRLIDLG
jgi:putative phosphoesterase